MLDICVMITSAVTDDIKYDSYFMSSVTAEVIHTTGYDKTILRELVYIRAVSIVYRAYRTVCIDMTTALPYRTAYRTVRFPGLFFSHGCCTILYARQNRSILTHAHRGVRPP